MKMNKNSSKGAEESRLVKKKRLPEYTHSKLGTDQGLMPKSRFSKTH